MIVLRFIGWVMVMLTLVIVAVAVAILKPLVGSSNG
jgi:hypothetical protein